MTTHDSAGRLRLLWSAGLALCVLVPPMPLSGADRRADIFMEPDERLAGADYRDKAMLQRERGNALGIDSQLLDAEKNLRIALRQTQHKHGVRHPAVARDLRFLATLYRAREKYAEAEALIRWSLEILEAAQGPFNLDVASNLIYLADLCFDRDRFFEAENYYTQAVTIREQMLGPDHPGVAEGLDHYAILLREIGRIREAESLELRANSIRADHASLLD